MGTKEKKRYRFQTTVKNKSAFPIALVWENAKDLEHVAAFHQKTNKGFEIIYVGKEKETQGQEYDVMVFRSQRKYFGIPLQSFGFRKIMNAHHLYQIETIPFLRMTVALNSLLRTQDDPKFPTEMVDEVVIEGPRWLRFFTKVLHWSLKRHTAIQCAEDESFRARRLELKERGIELPYKLFFVSYLERLQGLFTESLS